MAAIAPELNYACSNFTLFDIVDDKSPREQSPELDAGDKLTVRNGYHGWVEVILNYNDCDNPEREYSHKLSLSSAAARELIRALANNL